MSFKRDRDSSQSPAVVSRSRSLSSPQRPFLMERMAVRTISGLLSKECWLFWATKALCPGNPSESSSLEPQLSYFWPWKEIPDHSEVIFSVTYVINFWNSSQIYKGVGFPSHLLWSKLPAWQQASRIKRGPHHSADFTEEVANAQMSQKDTQAERNKRSKNILPVQPAQSAKKMSTNPKGSRVPSPLLPCKALNDQKLGHVCHCFFSAKLLNASGLFLCLEICECWNFFLTGSESGSFSEILLRSSYKEVRHSFSNLRHTCQSEKPKAEASLSLCLLFGAVFVVHCWQIFWDHLESQNV